MKLNEVHFISASNEHGGRNRTTVGRPVQGEGLWLFGEGKTPRTFPTNMVPTSLPPEWIK